MKEHILHLIEISQNFSMVEPWRLSGPTIISFCRWIKQEQLRDTGLSSSLQMLYQSTVRAHTDCHLTLGAVIDGQEEEGHVNITGMMGKLNKGGPSY